jgi:ATP/maltotriose-dependent transcriptional regulator MalT
VREGLIERPDLVERLREGRERSLTLVCAPAGYGKTTLIAQWEAADREHMPFAWISLDERDSDPVRLWAHLIAGLQEVIGGVGDSALETLPAGPRSIAVAALPLLVEDLRSAPPLVVVLDDWNLVRDPVCDETIGALVEQAPEQVQVAISSRSDPGLPIARLRAHGELTEVRATDLRISAEQAAKLFHEAGVELEVDDVERITARTEGWLAGICLALLVVKEREDRMRFVAEFSGDTRHVLDYLARDVLDSVRPELRDFVMRTSVLERLSAELCDAVLERTDSEAMLVEIERDNLFLVQLDEAGREYRYHHLFASMLQRELEASDREAPLVLHARASDWYEANGDFEAAVKHAIESRGVARASSLVTRHSVSMISTGRTRSVNRWLDSLSWPAAEADPQLAVTRALAAGMTGRGRDEIERWLEVAAAAPDTGLLANGITSLSAGVAMIRSLFLTRGIVEAERGARFVLEQEPETSPWRYAGLVPLGQALFLQGRYEEARTPLAEARALPGARALASTSVGVSYQALIELDAGDVASAERLAREALALAVENGHSSDITAANPHLAIGRALMQSPDLYAAIDHLERAVELSAPLESPYWHVHALLHLVDARHRLGDDEGAGTALAQARAVMDDLPDVGMLGDLMSAVREELASRSRREGFLGQNLSEAELRVLRSFASGASIADVARELYLSQNTVKTHRRTIYRKLGASTRDEMLERAAEAGLLEGAAPDVLSVK